MFRRSRFSIRPNVSTTGRTAAATPQEATSANQEASETPRDVGESSTPTAVTDTTSDVTPSEKPTAPGDCNDQNGEGTSSSAAVQRRKRFSVKPKVAPGRPSTLSRTPKSPVKATSDTPVEVPGSDHDKPTTSSQPGTTAGPPGLQSPRRGRPSEESKQAKVQPPPTNISSDCLGPSAVPPAEDSPEQTDVPTYSGKQLESKSGSQVKDISPRPSDKVPPSLPDKEAVEISEKAKTLVSSKSGLSLSRSAFCLSRLLNDPSDLQRLAKAQKLRELLRQERHKEKKLKKAKARPKEITLDPSKMTMRDLIRYLPESNPMTSSLEESAQENETVVPPSPGREESPERAQEPEVSKAMSGEENEEVTDEEQEESLMVPQVKVAEDGSLIIDEASLTVEVQRAKGPNPAQDRDPIFERGSTTTYSSFRKGNRSKPWSSEETDMFFLAISMVGTDFSMICQLFPHRARAEIKNKFKKEERENSWRIDKAFRERRKLDIEYFSKLLEKILEVQKNRKKLKKLSAKNAPKKQKKKSKGKKAAKKLSDGEDEDEEDDDEVLDLADEKEGEKENEDLCNEGGTPVVKPKRQRKRKSRQAAMKDEPDGKKNKTDQQSNEQGEACTPEETEAALPEDHTTSDMSAKPENANASKDTAIKPAKLSRGRAPKPLLPLGRKWGKKAPAPSTKAKDTASDKGDESASDGASKEQASNDSSPTRQGNKRKSPIEDTSSEEEDATVQPPRPTRYGRVPKPTNPLNYPAKEEAHTSASDPSPTSPARATLSDAKRKPKSSAKRGRSSKQKSAQESKKPKLVTLRALEYTDDEDEQERDHEEIEEEEHPACSPSKDSIAPVFVPASLRSPHPVISEVEETMEELDILANMPDVLGISQDALCPDASCERAQNERGTAEPCEHQLDLLVDVIDFLSSEHTEVSEDESYNEAAQTLLTIGNLTHLPQSVQNQSDTEDHITGTTSVIVMETTQHSEEESEPKPAEQEENTATHLMSGNGVTETPETVAIVEPQNTTTDIGDVPIIKTSDQMCGEQKTVSDMDPSPELQSLPESSKKNSPQSRRGHLSKVKPNICQASRTEQPKSLPATSTLQTAEESNTEAANLQVTESVSAPEQTASKVPEYSPTLQIDDTVSQVESGTATSEQGASENQSQSFSDAQCEPCGEQASRDTGSTEPLDEKVMSHAEMIMSCSNNSATSNTSVTESQVEQGLNTGSVQGGSHHVTPINVPVCQKAEIEVGSTCQSRRSRMQKVKPKPNLPQISRTARATPQTSKDSIEKDSSSTPISQDHEKPTCSTSTPKTSENIGPVSALTPTRESSTTEEKKTAVYSITATSDQSASENQSFSEDLFEPCSRDTGSTSESTDEKETTNDGITESSNDLVTFDSTVQESRVEQVTAAVQESSDQSATCVTPVDLPASQKAESEVASTSRSRRGRLQKVKPKPNIPQTSRAARSTPQSTNDSVEKESSSTPISQDHEKPITDVEPEATCCTSPQKRSENIDPASVLVPSLDLGSTLTPTREPSTTEEKKTDVEPVGQVYSVSATSDQSASENQSFSEDLFEPCSRETGSTSESTDEKETTNDGTTESSNDLVTFDSLVEQVAAAVQEGSDQPATCVTPVEDLSFGHKAGSEVMSTLQTRRGRLQKVKPKPNLAQTSRTVRLKPQTTNASSPRSYPESTDNRIAEAEPICSVTFPGKSGQSTGTVSGSVLSLQPCTNPSSTEELPSTLEQKTDVGSDSSSQSSEPTVPQRRRHFPKVRPNLGSSTRTTQTKLQLKNISKPLDKDMDISSHVTSEQQPVDNSQTELTLAEEDCDQPSSQGHKPNSQPLDTLASVSDVQSSEEGSIESKLNPVLAADAYFTLDLKESSPQPGSESDTELKNEDAAQQCSETSETNQTSSGKSQSAQSTDDTELTDSPKSLKKAPQTRRGRLVKPKPNLGRGSRPPQPQQVQNTTQIEADSDTLLEDVDATVSHKPETEHRPDIQEPVEGAVEPHTSQEASSNDDGSLLGCLTQIIEHLSQHDSPTNDAVSSLGCVTQARDNSLQNMSTLSAEATQSHPTLTMFPGMLSEQVPSDPDEPFFILSLTEIPVCSSGQAVDSAAEPLPYLHVADASIQQHSSVPGESLVSVGDGSLSNVPVPMSMEESGDMAHISEKDTGLDSAAYIDSIVDNPVDPQEGTTVQPKKLPETEEKNDETSSKQGPTGTESRAKLQVRPNTTRKKQPSKSPATNTNQDSELPEASLQPEAADATAKGDDEVVTEPQKSGERVNTAEESPAGGDGPEDHSSRAQPRTTKPKVTSVEKRTAPPSDPSPGKASSKGCKGKTPRARRKCSTPTTPVSSTSHSVAPTPNVTQLPDDTHSTSSTTTLALTEVDIELTPEQGQLCSDSTPSTSQSSAEVSASQQSDCVESSSVEEEPTSVSQYFLSDIFTEVEEG